MWNTLLLVDIYERKIQKNHYNPKNIKHQDSISTQRLEAVQKELDGKLLYIANMLRNRIDSGQTNVYALQQEFGDKVHTYLYNALLSVDQIAADFSAKFLGMRGEQLQEDRLDTIVSYYEKQLWTSVQKHITTAKIKATNDYFTKEALFGLPDLFAFLVNDATYGTLNQSVTAYVLAWQPDPTLDIELIWISERDEKVCAECRHLDGQRAIMGKERYHGLKGTYEQPPAHPNCRCRTMPMDDDDKVFSDERPIYPFEEDEII